VADGDCDVNTADPSLPDERAMVACTSTSRFA
jgi:hypothetical protein